MAEKKVTYDKAVLEVDIIAYSEAVDALVASVSVILERYPDDGILMEMAEEDPAVEALRVTVNAATEKLENLKRGE